MRASGGTGGRGCQILRRSCSGGGGGPHGAPDFPGLAPLYLTAPPLPLLCVRPVASGLPHVSAEEAGSIPAGRALWAGRLLATRHWLRPRPGLSPLPQFLHGSWPAAAGGGLRAAF